MLVGWVGGEVEERTGVERCRKDGVSWPVGCAWRGESLLGCSTATRSFLSMWRSVVLPALSRPRKRSSGGPWSAPCRCRHSFFDRWGCGAYWRACSAGQAMRGRCRLPVCLAVSQLSGLLCMPACDSSPKASWRGLLTPTPESTWICTPRASMRTSLLSTLRTWLCCGAWDDVTVRLEC